VNINSYKKVVRKYKAEHEQKIGTSVFQSASVWYLWGYANGRGWRRNSSPYTVRPFIGDLLDKMNQAFEEGIRDGEADKDL